MVGNGGFGPGFGVIGLKGGYASDYGTLVETFATLRPCLTEAVESLRGSEALSRELLIPLPYCELGGNMFACVHCHGIQDPVYSLEQGVLWREKYNLYDFFQLWTDGIDYSLHQDGIEIVEREYINPFTGNKETQRGRYRRRP
jgi:hypothetical protein